MHIKLTHPHKCPLKWSVLFGVLFFLAACTSPRQTATAPPVPMAVPPAPLPPAPLDRPGMPAPQEPPPLPAASSAALPAIHYTIQVGAFSTAGRAADHAARMQSAGLDAYHFVDSDGMYKVRFERFDTKDAAQNRALELQAKGLIEAFFIVHPTPTVLPFDPSIALQEGIVQAAHRLIGTAYQWGGTSKSQGFDCSGLTMTVYRLVGLELPRSAADQFRIGTPVHRDALQPGDLVFFATSRFDRISHVGIYSGQGRFIHAPGRGKSIRSASLSNSYFKAHYRGARRYY